MRKEEEIFFYYSNNKAVEVSNRYLCETTTQNQQDNDTEKSFPNFIPPFLKRLVEGIKNTNLLANLMMKTEILTK